MDIMQAKTAFHSGADVLENAADQVRNGAGRMAGNAKYGMRKAGNEVNAFVHRRPVETALLSAAAACLITGIAFWLTRPD